MSTSASAATSTRFSHRNSSETKSCWFDESEDFESFKANARAFEAEHCLETTIRRRSPLGHGHGQSPMSSSDMDKFRHVLRTLYESSYRPNLDAITVVTLQQPQSPVSSAAAAAANDGDDSLKHAADADATQLLMALANERALQRESMLEYLFSVQEYLQEEQDEHLREECLKEMFQEMSRSSRQFAHSLAKFMLQSSSC